MADTTVTEAKDVLSSGYEELRCSALGRASGAGRGVGFALFVRSGMAAWMKTCAILSKSPQIRRSVAEIPIALQDFRVEVAMLLAEMALMAYVPGGMTT